MDPLQTPEYEHIFIFVLSKLMIDMLSCSK